MRSDWRGVKRRLASCRSGRCRSADPVTDSRTPCRSARGDERGTGRTRELARQAGERVLVARGEERVALIAASGTSVLGAGNCLCLPKMAIGSSCRPNVATGMCLCHPLSGISRALRIEERPRSPLVHDVARRRRRHPSQDRDPPRRSKVSGQPVPHPVLAAEDVLPRRTAAVDGDQHATLPDRSDSPWVALGFARGQDVSRRSRRRVLRTDHLGWNHCAGAGKLTNTTVDDPARGGDRARASRSAGDPLRLGGGKKDASRPRRLRTIEVVPRRSVVN